MERKKFLGKKKDLIQEKKILGKRKERRGKKKETQKEKNFWSFCHARKRVTFLYSKGRI